MTQGSLFDARPAPAHETPREEQAEQIGRVVAGIGLTVLDFCRARVGLEFYMSELLEYVATARCGFVAPGSPDRVLRALKKGGRVRYSVVSRKDSLYRVEAVRQ